MIPDYAKMPENTGLSLEKGTNLGEWFAVDWKPPPEYREIFAVIQCGSLGWFVFPPGDKPGISDKPVAGPYPVSDAAFNAAIAWYRGLPIPPTEPVKTAPPKKSYFT